MTTYITEKACTGYTAYKEVGFGHQMKDQVTPIIIAEIMKDSNFKYANMYHRPLDIMGLEVDDVSVNDLPKDIPTRTWSQLGVTNGMPYKGMLKIIRERPEGDNLILLRKQCRIHLHQVWEWQQQGLIQHDAFNAVRIKLYNKFMKKSAKNFPIYLNPLYNIGVHIRRGDIADPKFKNLQKMGILKHDNPNKMHAVLSIDWYVKAIQLAIKTAALETGQYEVHIFTESKFSEDVVNMANVNGYIIHINEKFGSDFMNMIHCDALVMSNSGMSTLAGYLSTKSKKYYHPNPHSPTSLPSDEYIQVLT